MTKDKIEKLKMALLGALGAGAVATLLYFADAIKAIFS